MADGWLLTGNGHGRLLEHGKATWYIGGDIEEFREAGNLEDVSYCFLHAAQGNRVLVLLAVPDHH